MTNGKIVWVKKFFSSLPIKTLLNPNIKLANNPTWKILIFWLKILKKVKFKKLLIHIRSNPSKLIKNIAQTIFPNKIFNGLKSLDLQRYYCLVFV